MSASTDVDMVDAVDDRSLHELMDKMEDLGFATATVDAIGEILEQNNAFDNKDGMLTNIFRQLLNDLQAYAYGRLYEAPSAGSSHKSTIQSEIFASLEKEHFPHPTLLKSGPSFLDAHQGRLMALDFLLSEVQASKMIALMKHKEKLSHREDASSRAKKRTGGELDDSDEPMDSTKRVKGIDDANANEEAVSMEDVPNENEASQELSYELHLLAHTLQIVLNEASLAKLPSASSSPARLNGVTALQLLRQRITNWMSESPFHAQAIASPPLFHPTDFNSKQLMVLADVYRTFQADYSLRVRVMRKRLEVTLQSFMWGGKGKTLETELTRLASSKLSSFPHNSLVDEYELWAATPHVLYIARMTSREYAMRSSIKRIIIGAVPDRGGRVDTNTRIENEWGMPAFTARSESGDAGSGHKRGGGGGGGGHRGGHRGGRGGGGGRGRGR